MGKQDIILLLGLLVPVLLLVVLAAMFPIYLMQDGSYERHFVGSPPVWEFGGNLQRLSEEEVERLLDDPQQRQILEGNLETRQFHPRPVFVGPLRGNMDGKNWLGATAFYAMLLYLTFAVLKWINRG